MKMKSVVLLAVALGFGFVAMLGVQQAMRAKTVDAQTKNVLVSRTEITAFTVKLDQTNVMFAELPLDQIPEDAITDAADYDGRALKYHVLPKWPITKSMLTAKGQVGVANLIPEGMRLSTIKASSTQTHSNMVNPGDRIDIMVTFKLPGDQKPITKTVLEDIKVFCLDKLKTGGEAEESGKAKIENLSVLVTPEQAARLSMAEMKGSLNTVLRNPNDKTKSNTNLLTDEDFVALDSSGGQDRLLKDPGERAHPPVMAAKAAEPPPAPEPPVTQPVADATPVAEMIPEAEGPKPWILEIYEGDTLRREEVYADGNGPVTTDAKPIDIPPTEPAAPLKPGRQPKGKKTPPGTPPTQARGATPTASKPTGKPSA